MKNQEVEFYLKNRDKLKEIGDHIRPEDFQEITKEN